MASRDIVRADVAGGFSPPTSRGSALSEFLKHTVIYETAHSVIPRDLLQFGVFGSAAAVLTGLLALVLPGTSSIEHSGVFLVFGSEAAGLASLLRSLAVPCIVIGCVLLTLDVYLARVPTSEQWRLAVVGQAVIGGLSATVGVLFLAFLVLNLAIWVAIGVAFMALVALVLGGLASGG